METRSIGGLSVSVVGLGCNQFGTAGCDEATSHKVVDEAIESGITFFDIADEYGMNYADPTDPEGWGRSEEILGDALKGRRDQVVVASKFGIHPHADTQNRGGASARWARLAIEDSLRRLQTDRIDLYQLHMPDPTVPLEETLGALQELVQAGKVLEIGCCNINGKALREAAEIAASHGLPQFRSTQSALNLFKRTALDDEIPACEELGMVFIPYYPLASGMLTGKYKRGETPQGTRLTEQVDRGGPPAAVQRPHLRPPGGPRGLRPGARSHPARAGLRLAPGPADGVHRDRRARPSRARPPPTPERPAGGSRPRRPRWPPRRSSTPSDRDHRHGVDG